MENLHRTVEDYNERRRGNYTAWDEPCNQPFTLASAKPSSIPEEGGSRQKPDDEVKHFIAYGSWIFCSLCNRRRPVAAKTMNIAQRSATCESIERECGKGRGHAHEHCGLSAKVLDGLLKLVTEKPTDDEEHRAYVREKLGQTAGTLTTEQSYVSPRKEDWPLWDATAGIFDEISMVHSE